MYNLEKKQPQSENQVERFDSTRTFAPPVDVFEGTEETWLVADLPGVKREDLQIEMENNELRFRAKAKLFSDDAESFDWARAFRIPPGIDGNKVTADLKDGVLTLKLPKPAELKPRKIDVRVG